MRLLLLSAFSLITHFLSAQTLFTYGKNEVTAPAFIQAFEKNNAAGQLKGADREKAIREYLPLYINSRLKIQSARDQHLDTMSSVKAELVNLRGQVIENYMADSAAIDKLVQEAYQRSQKDIHAAYIFISYTDPKTNKADTALAKKKLADVEQQLKAGKNFTEVAKQFSDAPDAQKDGGDLGFITVFTLPYNFENIVYNTPSGKNSNVVKLSNGYYIFKNIKERPARGVTEAQQILLSYSPAASSEEKNQQKKLADSLYQLLKKDADFGVLAEKFSNDYISAARMGKMSPIKVGEYDMNFDAKVGSLTKDESFTEPFETSYGWHIVKRTSQKPLINNINDRSQYNELLSLIKQDDRWKTTREAIYAKVKKSGFTKADWSENELWAFTDSILDKKPVGRKINLTPTTKLFTIGKESYQVSDWISFAQSNRFQNTKRIAYPDVMNEFEKSIQTEYYRNHLEAYNPEFKAQMNEFVDGNLFFEIMQREVWDKAQNETDDLKEYFEKNKSKYHWGKSADAVIFFSPDANMGKTLFDQVKARPNEWNEIIEPFGIQVMADSGRFEWSQIPGISITDPKAGTLTTPVLNQTDNTYSFALLQKIYTESSPRSFEQARGLVINDYQQVLEEKWTAALRKKYPVKVNQKVLDSISK